MESKVENSQGGIAIGDLNDRNNKFNCDEVMEKYLVKNVDFHILYTVLKREGFPPLCDTYLKAGLVDNCNDDDILIESQHFKFNFMHYNFSIVPMRTHLIVEVDAGLVTNIICRRIGFGLW
jgi:hypothetical protein